jgi:uncharacterized protein (TIGR03437 family)
MKKLHLLSLLTLAGAALCPAQVTVVNGASFRLEQPLATGSWATAYASIGAATKAIANNTPFPATLGGVQILVDGKPAPLYYVDPAAGQINFLVPSGVDPGVRPLRVTVGGANQDTTVRIMRAAPGIFVIDSSLKPGLGAILNQDSSLNGSSNRAKRGELIQIFATGPGRLSQDIADGAAAPSSPLVTTVSTPQVYIGGVEAKVQFSGMAPGFAGLWQVNAYVPNQSFLSGRVPVQIYIDGVDSNEVSLFVAQ